MAPQVTDAVTDLTAVQLAGAALDIILGTPVPPSATDPSFMAAVKTYQGKATSGAGAYRQDGVLDWRTWASIMVDCMLHGTTPNNTLIDPSLFLMASGAASALAIGPTASMFNVTPGNTPTQIISSVGRYFSQKGAKVRIDGIPDYFTLAALLAFAYG